MRNIISIDEMPVYLEMHPTHGWSAKGKVIYQRKKRMRSKKYSLIMAISNKGVIAHTLHEDSINGEKFLEFLEDKVIPIMKKKKKSHLLMDNVNFHKSKNIMSLLDQKHIKPVFTIPYTPDLNPIENVFSICKKKLQKCKNKTFEELDKEIAPGGAMPLILPKIFHNMYKRSFGLTDFKIQRF